MYTYPMKNSSRTYTLVYQKEKEGGYSGHCLQLSGAISQGETLDELKENMIDAIKLILEDIEEEASEKKKRLIEITV
jgi:predicted RNase H-like HicB family nuclease